MAAKELPLEFLHNPARMISQSFPRDPHKAFLKPACAIICRRSLVNLSLCQEP